MKTLIILLLATMFASCATNYRQQLVENQQELIEDTVKEDKIIGGELPSWTNKSGIENGIIYVVGKAEMDANKSEFFIEKAALMQAEMNLLTDAPTDVRILTQNALTGSGIDSSEFYQIQTKLQEVVGLTGIRHSSERTVCRKVIRYGNLGANLTRSCWVQVQIRAKDLVKAYERTLALKFGTFKANQFKNLMEKEINKINNNHLMGVKNENNNVNISNNVRTSNLRTRLPATQTKKD